MANPTAILIDLSGTLHVDDVCIAGAPAALKRLRENTRYKIKFVTNTTKDSSKRLHSRLTSLGFKVSPSEIFSSLSAAKRFIQQKDLRPLMLLEDSALEDFEDIDKHDLNAVLIGLAPTKFNYQDLNRAFRLLLEGAKLIAIHKGRYYKRTDGLALGPGPFVELLRHAAGVEPEVIGKPEPDFFLSALQSFDASISARDAIMIGDDVRDDVLGAINIGMKAVLVKTGKYRPGDEKEIPEMSRNCVESFAEAVELIEKNMVK